MNRLQILGFFKRNPVGVICGLLSVVLAVLVYFRSDALASAEEKLQETTALGKRYAANLAHAAQLKEQFEGLVAANKAIEERFARASQLTQNLQYFYKLEADTGVRMTVTPVNQGQSVAAATAARKALIPVAFAVSVQGDYASVVEFLRRVEQGAYYSRVLTCTLNAAGMAGVDTGSARSMTLGLSVELLGNPMKIRAIIDFLLGIVFGAFALEGRAAERTIFDIAVADKRKLVVEMAEQLASIRPLPALPSGNITPLILPGSGSQIRTNSRPQEQRRSPKPIAR